MTTTAVAWREQTLTMPDLDLAWFEAGDGPTVVFLHGGPGLDHRLLRPLATPLTRRYRCVLPDQRGSGRSRLDRLDGTTLHVDRFLANIEALRTQLGEERLRLVGWSWGAFLALLYGAVHPERVERLALIAPGPVEYELIEVYRANLVRPLTAAERRARADLVARGEAALEAGDREGYRALHRELMALTFRVWFYDPDLAERHLESYLASAGDPYDGALVGRHVLGSLGEFGAWERIGTWDAPTLVLYGYQDFEPITQAYQFREWIPQARLAFLNECGHFPWLEQPEAFYHELGALLGDEQGREERPS